MGMLAVFPLFFLVLLAHSAPANDVDFMAYLRNFGYLQSESSSLVDQSDLVKEAISDFQYKFGVEMTGSMNAETKKAMKLRRCGCKDKKPNNSPRFKASPYHVWGDNLVWNKTKLTYKVAKSTNQLTKLDIEEAAATSFKFWSDVSKLKFELVSDNSRADINIKFVTGEHGDQSPFDGPGGLIGHGYPPDVGYAHFDDAEKWSVGPCDDEYINLIMVMTHEFGHCVGMAHSHNRKNVMYPSYRGCNPLFALSEDDIKGIQFLYGKNENYITTKSTTESTTSDYSTTTTGSTTTTSATTTTTTTTTQTPSTSTTETTSTTTSRETPTASTTTTSTTTQTPTTTTLNEWTPNNPKTTTKYPQFTPYICLHAEFDAYAYNNGHVRAFKGSVFYNINHVRPIKRLNSIGFKGTFENGPGSVEAALSINKRLLLFKDGIVYSYLDTSYSYILENGFPKRAEESFPGIPAKIDAAFEIYDKIYFLRRGKFFSGTKKSSGSIRVYPSEAPVKGIPNKIDGAYADEDNDLYLFSGKFYFKVLSNEETISEQGKISEYFLMCSKYMDNSNN